MPRTIRQTSDAVQFGGLRVLVRELPAVGELDVPGGLDHFCFCYWPRPNGSMIHQQKDRDLADPTEGSPLFIAPDWPFQCEWNKIEAVVANFQLQPAFLEEAAALLRIDFRRLYESAVRIVALDEPLESLSRALAVALVQRLVLRPDRP